MKQKLNCVLLIDDDEPTNFMSSILLEEANCVEHIEIAESGRNALNYLANIRQPDCEKNSLPLPDLIFLDINMPAMDGWEFLDEYKALIKEHCQKIIIIMLTTSMNPDDALRAYAIPEVSGFENKPITIEKLYDILRKYFPNYFKAEPKKNDPDSVEENFTTK